MPKRVLALITVCLGTRAAVQAFNPILRSGAVRSRAQISGHTTSALLSSPEEQSWNNEHPDDYLETEVKNLLTAKSMATVVFYANEFGDDKTGKWLKTFEGTHDLHQTQWHGFLGDMLRSEPEEILVRKLAQRPQGGSGNNPYLSNQRVQREYTVLIDPRAIAKRVMTVREQIATEWRADLALVEAENTEVARFHQDAATISHEAAERGRHMIFDYDAYGNTHSVFRFNNYKELLDMVTRSAIKRYEMELRGMGQKYHQNWIERFMHKTGKDLKGNALLEAMLNGQMIMLKPSRPTDKPKVIMPAKIAEAVMARRAAAAAEYIRILEGIETDHARLNRAHLESHFSARTIGDTIVYDGSK